MSTFRRVLLLFLVTLPCQVFAQRPAVSRVPEATPRLDYVATMDSLLDGILTETGRVRYTLLSAEYYEPFRGILRAIETFDVSLLRTDRQKLAFWMNAYNMQMLASVHRVPELRNIVSGRWADRFFKTPFLTGGLSISLDEIEHQLLRRSNTRNEYRPFAVSTLDARIHVGLNCAAVSCPSLQPVAFTEANLDSLLDKAMADFVNAETHFRVTPRRIEVSSLIEWFGEDFDRADQPAGDFLLGFMSPDRPDYAVFRDFLKGKSGTELMRAQTFGGRAVVFRYDWSPNRADGY